MTGVDPLCVDDFSKIFFLPRKRETGQGNLFIFIDNEKEKLLTLVWAFHQG